MRVLAETPLSDEWFAARRVPGRITSSLVPAILGVSREEWCYKTARSAWAILTGRADPVQLDEDREELAWGRDTETLHRTKLARKLSEAYPDNEIRIEPSPGLVCHDDDEYLAATPDGIVYLDGAPWAAWEAKAPTLRFGVADAWDSRAPLGPATQGSWHSAVLGLEVAIVSVLIPPRVRWYAVEVPTGMLAVVAAWRERYVVGDVEPPVPLAQAEDVAAEIQREWAALDFDNVARYATEDDVEILRAYEEADDAAKSANLIAAQRKAAALAAFGTASYLVNGSATWSRRKGIRQVKRVPRGTPFVDGITE